MIFTIIAIIILFYAFFNFKKAFLVYLIFDIVWFPNAKIVNLDGFPSIPIYLVVSAGFTVIYLFKYKRISKHQSCPYFVPLLLLTISRFLTCFTSIMGPVDEFSRALGYFFYNFIQVLLIWRVLKNENDFLFVFKGYIIVFFFAGVYGLIEYGLQNNIIDEYKSTLTPEGLAFYRTGIFRGYRLMSIFEHPIGTGINFSLFIILILLMGFTYRRKIPYKIISYISIVLSAICIFLTHMRSGIFFLLISLIGTFNFRKKRTYIFLFTLIIVMAILITLFPQEFAVFASLFSEKARQQVGGSSLDQRMSQFRAVMALNSQSPFLGLGERFMDKQSPYVLGQILSLESVWFEELTKHGFVGVFCTALMIIYSLVIIPIRYKNKEVFFISLAYWMTYTVTSLPFVRMSLYYVIIFYCLRYGTKRTYYSNHGYAILQDRN